MEPVVAVDVGGRGVPVDRGGDPDRRCSRGKARRAGGRGRPRRARGRRRALHVAGQVPEDAGRLAGDGVTLDLAGPLGAEVAVDPAELQGQGVQRGVGAGGEQDGVGGRGAVQLGAGRIAPLRQPGDEHLADDHPASRAHGLGPGPDVIQDVADGLHLGDRVVGLGRGMAPLGWVCESIRPGRTILPPRSTTAVAGPRVAERLLVGPDHEEPVAADRDGLADREVAVDGDDLAAVQDQVGLVGPAGDRANEGQEAEGQRGARGGHGSASVGGSGS